MAFLRVVRQMGIWALVFMMAGCVSPFAYKLIDPTYQPGNLEPPVYGFVGLMTGVVFGLFVGIAQEMRRRQGGGGGKGPGGVGPGPWGG